MRRREFTRNMILSSMAASSLPLWSVANSGAAPVSRTIKKGIMWGNIGVGTTILEKFQAAKAAGFDGVEVYSHLDREQVLKAKEQNRHAYSFRLWISARQIFLV